MQEPLFETYVDRANDRHNRVYKTTVVLRVTATVMADHPGTAELFASDHFKEFVDTESLERELGEVEIEAYAAEPWE